MASNSDDNVSLPSSTHDEFLDDPDIVKSMEDDEVSLPSSVHDVSLPSSLEDHEILDELNNYDEDLDPDFVNAEDEHREFLDLFCKQCDNSHSSVQVPLPLAAAGLVGKHDVAEFYSPPRICPAARALECVALLSCDLVTGWDFRDPKLKSFSLNLLVVLEIMFVMLCPPCTMFSILQRLWNFKHWTQDEIDEKMSVAVAYVDHAMECAKTQVQHKHYFAFEHPHRSAAWDLESVSEVSSLDGVEIVNFDMCMLGLRSFNGIPMRKRTRLMTNVPGLVNALRGLYCDKCSHGAVHQLIQGSEGGMRRSVWSQQYPAGFADLVAREAARLKR